MTLDDFFNRAKFNDGFDREINHWKIIDIHEIPYPVEERHEVDFYCCDGSKVYLLRLRNRKYEKFEHVKGDTSFLIAELPIDKIDDKLVEHVLSRFDLIK